VDPVAGELRQPLVIAPPVFTDFANGVLMFATNSGEIGSSACDRGDWTN